MTSEEKRVMHGARELERFIEAQRPVYEQVVAELRAGQKRTHWMWFVFPQMRGLGFSVMAHRYGIMSAQEATDYWLHPVLGPRLRECTELLLQVQGKSAFEILGSPDDLKFKSSMTLFDDVAPEQRLFSEALAKFYAGERDEKTLELVHVR